MFPWQPIVATDIHYTIPAISNSNIYGGFFTLWFEETASSLSNFFCVDVTGLASVGVAFARRAGVATCTAT